jgi:hypothetical protein
MSSLKQPARLKNDLHQAERARVVVVPHGQGLALHQRVRHQQPLVQSHADLGERLARIKTMLCSARTGSSLVGISRSPGNQSQ